MQLFAIFFYFFLGTCLAREDDRKPMYTITAPNSIASRSSYTVEVFIHHAHKGVNVTVELQKPELGDHYHTFEPLSSVIRPGDGKSFRFKTKLLKSDSYTLRVIGTMGLKFEDVVTIPVNAKKETVLIQTDKGIYQSGQTVNFRVITLDTLLMPLVSHLHVNIFDGKNNLIKQWAQNTTQKGVFSSSLDLSANPVLGTWKIEVLNEDTATTIQTFSVQEYLLPTFEVTLRTQPTYITYNQSEALVIVDARYTHGQAVKGAVSLHIRDEYCTYNFVEKCDSKMYITEATNIVDEATIPINFVKDLILPETIYGFGFRNFKIEAVVIEELTKVSRNASMIITMHKDPIKIELVPAGSFKPGLNFTQIIKVTYHDDTPLLKGDGAVNVTVQFSSSHEDVVNMSLPMTATGIIKLELQIARKATSLSFQATYRGITGYASVPRAASSGNFEYIKLNQITPVAEVDKYMKIEVTSTHNLESRLILLVVARGDINYVKTFPSSDHSVQTIQFKVHESMSPMMTVLVYYVTPCGNLVVDAISIEVSGLFRTPVSIKLKHNITEPGKDMVLEIKSRPKSYIGLLAVDQSVLMLSKGNDITEQRVLEDLAQYEMSRSYFYNPLIIDKNAAFPHPWSTATNPLQVFKDGGLVIKTNFLEDVDIFAVPYAAVAMDKGVDVIDIEDAAMDSGASDVGPHIKKNFPETFLWIDSETNSAGKYTLQQKAPDAITTYIISAIAINEKTGFGIAYPTKLTIFKKFFSTMTLPLSVKKGETISIQILTFNYYDHQVKGTVTLHNEKSEFFFIEDKAQNNDATKPEHVNIQPKDGQVTTYTILPKNIGSIDLKVTTTGKYGMDAFVKKLLVKSEGFEHTINKPFLVDLSGMNQQFTQTIPIEYPANKISNSEKLYVSVIGNILGASIHNLGNLLSLPQGCGEQNMLNFAPDVVVATLLKTTARYPPDLQKKVLGYLEKGYQTQLTYHRSDGSFSAFGNTDIVGSTWLSAFVAKYFHQAANLTNIDKKVLESTLDFLGNQQSEDGSFKEHGTVIHKTMQGGSGEGLGLTAYVLISLIESKNAKYDSKITSAVGYLEKKIENVASVSLFDLIITAYALQLANSSKKETIFKAVSDKGISKDSHTHWDIQQDANKEISKPLSIEATAYVCLTYLSRNEIDNSLPLIRWLISQQSAQGGFESTQDTVIGIEALGNAAKKLVNKPGSTMEITVTAANETKTLKIAEDNAFVLQTVDLPIWATSVTISANGNGIAVVQISYSFNSDSIKAESSAFAGTVKTSLNDKNRTFDVQVCAKKQQLDVSNNMIVIDIAMATGSIANPMSLPPVNPSNETNAIKKVETKDEDTRVVLYFDAITEVCVNVSATQTHLIFNSKPALVKVYDYYEPDKRGEIPYNAPEMK